MKRKYLTLLLAMVFAMLAGSAHATLVTDAETLITTQATSATTLAVAALGVVAVIALFALVKKLIFAGK